MRNFIAIVEILGGIRFIEMAFLLAAIVVGGTILETLQVQQLTSQSLLDTTITGTLMSASFILTGLALWRKKTLGYFFSMFLQILQLFSFQIGTFVYLFSAPGSVGILFNNHSIHFQFLLGSRFQFISDKVTTHHDYFSINVLALFFLLYLLADYYRHCKHAGRNEKSLSRVPEALQGLSP